MTKIDRENEDIKREDIRESEEDENKDDAGGEEKEDAKVNEDGDEAEKESEDDGDTRYLRLMADFQNYKKRVEKEKSDLYSYANENIVSELLNVLDNFERALEHDDGDNFKSGMEMIFKQLLDVLQKSGLSEIEALGLEFDPKVHNAVMTEETDQYESGQVSGVMQKGYTLNGKVIRPSMVKVVG